MPRDAPSCVSTRNGSRWQEGWALMALTFGLMAELQSPGAATSRLSLTAAK